MSKRFVNKRPATERWRIFTFDVWGNARDGYEVNDRYSSGYVDLPPEATDDEIIACLQDEGSIKPKGLRRKLFNIDGDGDSIFIEYNGRPELGLEKQ